MRSAYPQDYGQMPAGDTSMSGVLSALARKKWWIMGATLVALLGALVFVSVVKPKYTGESKVLLENRDNYFTRPDREVRGNDPAIDAEAVQSQVQIIMSRDLAKAVIQKLNLGSLEEFDSVKKEPSTARRVLSLLGFAKDPLASSPDERVMETFMDKLLVFNLGKSRVISIEFSSRDPELAARGANVIADEYIRLLRDAKKSTTQGASTWLSQTLESLRAKVGEAEGKVEAYRAENGLLVGASNATIATQQLGEMNTQMSQARSAQSELQAKARMIREAVRTGRVFETSEVVNNELVRRLLEQRVAMKTQIALEERNLLPGHPRMKELNAQIADLESQIRTTAERTARTMENDSRVAGARVQSLQADFEGQKRTAATANESEVQLRALEREARALRDNYESYLAKYRDAMSRDADAASPADARVVSRAVTPQLPTFPKKVPIILLATIATLILSCAIIVTKQVFSTEEAPEYYATPQPVEAYGYAPSTAQQGHYPPAHSAVAPPPEIVVERAPPPQPEPQYAAEPAPGPEPVLRVRPQKSLDPAEQPAVRRPARQAEVPVVAAPVEPARQPLPPPMQAEANAALAGLAEDLAGLKPDDVGLIVNCHAYGADVATSGTSLPLARQMARLGSTVYVDLAGARGDVEHSVGQVMAAGVTDILAGRANFGDCIHRDRNSRLHIIPFGSSGFGAQGPDTAGDAFLDVLDALVQTYDFVMVDAGQLGTAFDDAMHQAGAIVMVSSRDDSDPNVARVFQRLDAIRPGCVTIVVEEPMMPPPRPANDRYPAARGVA